MKKPKAAYQIRHEKLIEFLSQFSQYSKENGEPLLKIVKEPRMFPDVHKISDGEILLAVVAFTDVLNIYSGSAGNIDLYNLLNSYLRIPEYRDRINSLVSEARSFEFNKSK